MTPQPELKPTLEAIMLMLSVGALTLVIAVAAITLIGFRRYLRERWIYQENWAASPTPEKSDALVAKMKVGSNNNTVSVFESGGKSHVLIEGHASEQEKKRLLRYLKSEGFI